MKTQRDKGAEPNIPFPTETLTEASAILYVPSMKAYSRKGAEYIPSKAPVFYNPIMAFNRDIAVLVLKAYQRMVDHSIRVCEAFSGCGVRGIRFAKEVQNINHMVLNDINPFAAQLTRINIERNRLATDIAVRNKDANTLLNTYAAPRERFDVVDIDPFGSPSPFLDSAVRATRRGGLLALTATDMAPLCGAKPLSCLRKYLGKPLRTEYCHEIAVRLLLNSVVLAAAKHDLGVKALFSHSTDHYIRVYAQIFPGAKTANESINRLGYIIHCFSCMNRRWSRGLLKFPKTKCEVCGGKMDVAGPLWMDRLFNIDFCSEMIDESGEVNLVDKRRALKLLNTALKEADGPPTYFVVDRLSKKMRLPGISKAALIEKLLESGYHATETHFNTGGIRSDASIKDVIKIISDLSY